MKKLVDQYIFPVLLQITMVTALWCLLIGFSGCAPGFSEMQSAKLVGKGNIEATPSFSTVSFLEDGESDQMQKHVGVQAAYGVAEGFDLRSRIEYIWNDDINATVIGVGPKFSIWKDHIAGYVPLGFAFGEDIETSETWQLHPTMLFTVPYTRMSNSTRQLSTSLTVPGIATI